MRAVSKLRDPAATASTLAAPMLRSLPRPDDEEGVKTELARHSLRAELVNPLTEDSWDKTIAMHRDATIFHSAAWARVLVDTYGHKPCYAQLSLNDTLQALVPIMEVKSVLTKARGVCLPFSDYCAPLLFRSRAGELVNQKLQQIARERHWRYFEIRSHSTIPDVAVASQSYYGHFLDLTIGRDSLFSNFSSSAQRAIRKAERSGLSVTIRSDGDAMTTFYKLHVRTRRRHGVPPQPWSFFLNIQRHLIGADHGFIVIVEGEKRPLAAAIFFKFGRHAIYKYGASDERLQKLRANNLAMSAAIKTLADAGAEILHFGRTEKENEGLRRFKRSWGATEEEIRYARFEMKSGSWKAAHPAGAGLHKHVFRALPASLNRLAGAMIYPHLD